MIRLTNFSSWFAIFHLSKWYVIILSWTSWVTDMSSAMRKGIWSKFVKKSQPSWNFIFSRACWSSRIISSIYIIRKLQRPTKLKNKGYFVENSSEKKERIWKIEKINDHIYGWWFNYNLFVVEVSMKRYSMNINYPFLFENVDILIYLFLTNYINTILIIRMPFWSNNHLRYILWI